MLFRFRLYLVALGQLMLILLGTTIAVGLLVLLATTLMDADIKQTNFNQHTRNALSTTYAPATFEQAKAVVLKTFDTYKTNPNRINIYRDYISMGEMKVLYFNKTDIIVNGVYMLLPEDEYIQYYVWFKEFSYPYCSGAKQILEPVSAPW